MRVVLYGHHSLFEPALSMVDALSPSAEVHVLLEVPSTRWQVASFEATGESLPSGLVPADGVLSASYPESVRAMWRRAASFHLVCTGRRTRDRLQAITVSFEVLRWIRALGADLLHVDDIDVSPRLALALAIAGAPCPTLIGCHDPDPHSGERHWWRKHAARVLAFSKAQALLVHHESGRTAFRRRHPRFTGPAYVVRLGSYALLRELASSRQDQPALDEPSGSSRARPTVLLFGRMTPYKGVELLFEAAPLVARAVPGVRFVVAGNPVPGYRPPDPPRLDNGGSIEARYEYVPNTHIGALFEAADVVACPYTDASQSGVVLTSYAFGCPVVATNVGGLPEYVSDGITGLVVPAGDVAALADALISCLVDTELGGRLRAGVATANDDDLSWDRVGRDLFAVYAEVAESPSPA